MDIYEHLKKGVRKSKNKVGIFICGASGSGKSSNKETILNKIKFQKSYISINLDEIILQSNQVEDSRGTLDFVLKHAVEDGYSIVYDGTCRYPKYVSHRMNFVKQHDYKIILVIVYADLKTILERIKKRHEQPLTEDFVKNVYNEVSKKVEYFMNMKDIDEVYLFSNETERTKMVFSRKDKKITCSSPDSNFYFDVSQYC
jgi:predicted ABC-type ATPase